METKYDWSNVPSDVLFIATDQDGFGFGYLREPRLPKDKDVGRWVSKQRDIAYFMIQPKNNHVVDYSKGWHWTRTLEERPK